MDTRLLEDALVLIEAGTLSAAAQRRNMTQPAFSRRIKSLEDWLGEPLIIRHANRIELSQTLINSEPGLRSLLRAMDTFRMEVSKKDAVLQPLIIASQHSLSTSAFPSIFGRLNELEPKPVVRLRTRNQSESLVAFIKQEVDILLSYQPHNLPGFPFDSTVYSRIWRRDALVPVIGGKLRHTLGAERLAPPDAAIVKYPDQSEFGRLITQLGRESELRLEGPTIVETAFSLGIVKLVLMGAGVGWVPHSLIHEQIQSGDAVMLASSYGRIPLNAVLHAHRGNTRATDVLDQLLS